MGEKWGEMGRDGERFWAKNNFWGGEKNFFFFNYTLTIDRWRNGIKKF